MKYVTLGVRLLLGLVFLVFGLDYFLHVLPIEGEPPKGLAGDYVGALAGSGILAVVKGLEAVGGALILSGRFTPLGLLLLGPVIVNIVLFDVFLTKTYSPLVGVLAAMSLYLLFVCRRNFAGILATPSR